MKRPEEKTSRPLISNNKKVLRFIINPFSGKNRKKNIEKDIENIFDRSLYDFDIFKTNSPEHATLLAKEAAFLGYDIVVAVGGDGTINEAGKSLVGSKTCLGIIPMGSGNGLARHLKIPENISEALKIIHKGKYLCMDIFKINEKVSFCTAGIGFDAHVAQRFSQSTNRGFSSYLSIVLKDYPKYKSRIFELIVDGKKIIKEALLLCFANSSQYGNNIRIAEGSKIDDGFIKVVILTPPPFYTLPLLFLMLKKGNISKSKYYETFCCKQVEIKEKNILSHIDGEPTIFPDGMKISVCPNSLKIISP